MRGVEGKAGTRRFGFSYILLVVAIVVYLGVSAYSALATEWKAKAEVPQIDPILQIIKGLRQYQQVTASFPQTFDQVEAPGLETSKSSQLWFRRSHVGAQELLLPLHVRQSDALYSVGHSARC